MHSLKTTPENLSRDSDARLLSLKSKMGAQAFKNKISLDLANGKISGQRYNSIRMVTRTKSTIQTMRRQPFVRKPIAIKRDLDETFIEDDCNDDNSCKTEHAIAENEINSFLNSLKSSRD